MIFPNEKMTTFEVVSLSHIGPRLTSLVMTPWPIKMGKPTESLAKLHIRNCGLKHPRKGMDVFNCCSCKSWRAYLRKELNKTEPR